MDIYGNPVESGGESLENGGVIDGSLEIADDLKVDGELTVVGDATFLGTTTIVDEIVTNDPLFQTGADNPNDLLNLGMINAHDNSTSPMYAGVVRRATDKKWVLLNNVTKPAPSSVVPASDAILEVKEVEGQLLSAPEVSTQTVSSISGISLATPTVTLASSANIFYDGVVNQGLINLPTEYLIQGKNRLTLRASDGDAKLVSENGGDTLITSSSGNVLIESVAGDVLITANSDLALNCTGQIDLNSGNVRVNAPPNDFFLPGNRGLANQVLSSDGAGTTTWADTANPFDQSLNISDSVRFAQVNVGSAAGGFTLPLARGTDGQIMKTDAAGVVSWGDLPQAVPTPSIGVIRDGQQTILDSTPTVVEWNGEDFKNGMTHDNLINPSRITAIEAGNYQFNCEIRWSANGTGQRIAYYIINGDNSNAGRRYGRTRLPPLNVAPAAETEFSFSAVLPLLAGDYVEVICTQVSGGPLTISEANSGGTQFGVSELSAFRVPDQGAGGGGGNPFDQSLNTTDAPTFAGLTLPSLTAPVDDIDVSARELTVQNPVAGSTTLEIRSNGAGDSVLAFNENLAARWEIYKTVGNDLAISNSGSGDDLVVFSNAASNSISLKKEVFIGGALPYKMPTARGTPGSTLVTADGAGTVVFQDKAYSESYFNNNVVNTTFSIIGLQVGIGGTLLVGNTNGAWSRLGTEVRWDGVETRLFKVTISFSVRNLAALPVASTEYLFQANKTGVNLPEASRAFTTFQNNYQVVHSSFLVNMSTGDKIEPKLTNLSNLVGVAVTWMSIIFTPV